MIWFSYFGAPKELHTLFSWEEAVKVNHRAIALLDNRQQAIWAIKSRSLALLTRLISQDPTCVHPAADHTSPIYLAATKGDAKIVELMLGNLSQEFCHFSLSSVRGKYPVNGQIIETSSPLYVFHFTFLPSISIY